MTRRENTPLLAFSLFFLLAGNAGAAPLPAKGTTDGLGVSIHFVDSPIDLDKIQAAGVKLVRMDLAWDQVEKKRGEYCFDAFDILVRQASERGMRVITILNYNNPLYGRDPSQASWQKGFSNFAAATASHFKGKGNIYELWNEPDGDNWPGGSNPRQYTAVARQAVPAMRAADPDCTIIGPVTCSATNLDFCKTCFENGLLDLVDALSVHAYGWDGDPAIPEKNVSDYTNVRYWMKAFGHKTLPIVISEWGYTVSKAPHSTYKSSNPIQLQADFLARSLLVNISEGILVSIWYDWKNDGTDPTVDEHNFGTVTADLKEKPAYQALKRLTTSLKGTTFSEKLNNGNSADWLLVFKSPDGCKTLAAWTTGDAHKTTVLGWGTLSLSSSPIYCDSLK